MFFRLDERLTPERHDGVADEFIHDAVILLNCESLQSKVSVEQRHHEQRSQPFRQAGEPDEIREQHGHFASPAGYSLCAGLREHVLQYSRIDVLAKGLLQALLRTQLLHEKIK